MRSTGERVRGGFPANDDGLKAPVVGLLTVYSDVVLGPLFDDMGWPEYEVWASLRPGRSTGLFPAQNLPVV
jgi:hypothetical protein